MGMQAGGLADTHTFTSYHSVTNSLLSTIGDAAAQLIPIIVSLPSSTRDRLATRMKAGYRS